MSDFRTDLGRRIPPLVVQGRVKQLGRVVRANHRSGHRAKAFVPHLSPCSLNSLLERISSDYTINNRQPGF